MATTAQLSLRGARTGEIRGDGPDGRIRVIGVSHEITSPRDPASGLPTGSRQHRPLVLVKELDPASPLLRAVLANNENLPELRLAFTRPTAGGGEEQHFLIELLNANLTNIRLEMLNNQFAETAPLAVREHVSFTYQRITWTWLDGGITASDDWEASVVKSLFE